MNVTNYNLKSFYTGILQKEAPLYAYQFMAEFIGLDDSWGISDSSDARNNISYFVQSANIPGVTLSTGKTTFLGKEFTLPGVATYTHSWNCNIMLDQNLTAYKGFRKWQEDISSLYFDGGGVKAIPDVKVRLSVISSDGSKKVRAIVLDGVWCTSVGDIQLAYKNGGSDPITNFVIGLKYQYSYEDSGFDLSADPLKA